MAQTVSDVLQYGVEHQKRIKDCLQEIAAALELEFFDFDELKTHPYDYAVGDCKIEIETYQKPITSIEQLKSSWYRGVSVPSRRFKAGKAGLWIKQFPNCNLFIAVDLSWAANNFTPKPLPDKHKYKRIHRNGVTDDLENNYFIEIPWDLQNDSTFIVGDFKALEGLIKRQNDDYAEG